MGKGNRPKMGNEGKLATFGYGVMQRWLRVIRHRSGLPGMVGDCPGWSGMVGDGRDDRGWSGMVWVMVYGIVRE